MEEGHDIMSPRKTRRIKGSTFVLSCGNTQIKSRLIELRSRPSSTLRTRQVDIQLTIRQ